MGKAAQGCGKLSLAQAQLLNVTDLPPAQEPPLPLPLLPKAASAPRQDAAMVGVAVADATIFPVRL